MSKKEKIKKEIENLYEEAIDLARDFQDKQQKNFHYSYQEWYTKSIKVVSTLAPDRLAEFRSYYEIDPKRKTLGYGTYVIQDFMKGVVPGNIQGFSSRDRTLTCFLNQITILNSIHHRIDSVLANIEGEIFSELQDSEIIIARQLAKVSPRAAGALVGVIIEGHLQKVAKTHNLNISKKNPTIADLNDPLKNASIIDMPTWRKITYLADIRNICSHKKDTEPTQEQVKDLIDGSEWLTKTVF